ncbi:gamma-aminobutyric acid receptor-associated protein-like 2 isoform 3-T4 [Macrochelys suwanniensis]
MKWMFKEDHALEHRCVESAKIRAKYPDRVPVLYACDIQESRLDDLVIQSGLKLYDSVTSWSLWKRSQALRLLTLIRGSIWFHQTLLWPNSCGSSGRGFNCHLRKQYSSL